MTGYAGRSAWAVSLASRPADGSAAALRYALPLASAYVTSGLGYGGDVLWFGDSGGTLYGLDDRLQPVASTPRSFASGGFNEQIDTTPVPYRTVGGEALVLFAVRGYFDPRQPGSLLAFDPASGNTAAVPTVRMTLTALARGVSDGVLYAGGTWIVQTGNPDQQTTIPQVFGIRVDEAVQGLRNFVVESQLLQDFDPGPGGSTPPANRNGLVRYQTHLTLLDDTRAPRTNTPVKTPLLLNGQLHQVGPGDADYAVANSGADGVIILVSGAVTAGGADRPDVAAVPLRV